MRGPPRLGHRGFVVVLPVVVVLFLAALLLLPVSASFLQPGALVALLIAVATLVYAVRCPRGKDRPLALVIALGITAAMTIAMIGAPQSRLPLAFLLWYPWVGGYAGLAVNSRRMLAALTGVIVAAMTAAMVFRGDIVDLPMAYAAAVLAIVAVAAFTYGFTRWGRGQAIADQLTGLTSRAGLEELGEPVVQSTVLGGREAVLMVLDINRFREINSALGHAAGDEALREFAGLLHCLRPRPRFLGRLGGDEFVVILPGDDLVTHAADGDEIDQRLSMLGTIVLNQLDGPVRIRGVDVELEATVGIAVAPRDGDRLSTLLPCADAALATAKRDGSRVGIWSAGMVGVRSWELALHAQLRSAIARRELVMHYQPVQDASTRQVVGVEALIRWRHPVRGLLPPGSFLPMAERSSLILDLTWWELDEVLSQCAAWARKGLHVPVSANLSARMLTVDELPQLVTRRLGAYGLPPEMLTLEITESALVSQPARAAAMLNELRSAGVNLSLDDFGTGYSSMEILKALPFDEMKIDKSFVSDARGSLPDVAIVRSVVDLGHRLGLRVVGEGVEDERSARMLTELGCDLLQGDALSPAVPAAEVEPLLEANCRPEAPPGRRGAGRPGGRPYNGPGAAVDVAGAVTSRSTGPADGPEVPSPGERPLDAGAGRQAGDEPSWRIPRPGQTVSIPPDELRKWAEAGMTATVPPDEAERLSELRQLRVLDSPREPELDNLVKLAAQLTGCAAAHMGFVDADREWFKACHVFEISEIGARVGLASYIVAAGEFLEVPDIQRDLRYAHITGLGGDRPFRYVAGVPLRTASGRVVGALIVVDRVPRRMTAGHRAALQVLAEHAMRLLEVRLERLLIDEVLAASLRLEQYWRPEDLPAAANEIADVMRSITNSDAVSVMVPDLPGSTVFRAAGTSVAEGVLPATGLGIRANGDDEKAMRALGQVHEPFFMPDAAASPLITPDMARQLDIASALLVPLRDAGEIQGLITVRWVSPLRRLEPAVLRAVTLFARHVRATLAQLTAGPQPGSPAGGPLGGVGAPPGAGHGSAPGNGHGCAPAAAGLGPLGRSTPGPVPGNGDSPPGVPVTSGGQRGRERRSARPDHPVRH
ncbi:MAG: EAL domain-containing protein [Frankia sp.]|nr:EAL domain-containing protein [Frankia sp.]